MTTTRRRRAAIALALLAAALAPQAWAEGKHERVQRVPLLPKYQQECGSCHVAFPPGMLPAASWQRVMATLERHYGVDASLDAATTKELATFVAANAGTYRRVSEQPPQDRITRSAWFVRQHDEVPASAWKLAAVKNPSNCSACHKQADQGDFNERNVRIPR